VLTAVRGDVGDEWAEGAWRQYRSARGIVLLLLAGSIVMVGIMEEMHGGCVQQQDMRARHWHIILASLCSFGRRHPPRPSIRDLSGPCGWRPSMVCRLAWSPARLAALLDTS
jgi:hypothetical protein